MPYSVDILDSAKEEIIENTLYVMEKWGHEKGQESYALITEKLDLLATQPYMGIVVQELFEIGKTNYRIYLIEHHTKILYDVDDEKQKVTVHVVHVIQDFRMVFNQVNREDELPDLPD